MSVAAPEAISVAESSAPAASSTVARRGSSGVARTQRGRAGAPAQSGRPGSSGQPGPAGPQGKPSPASQQPSRQRQRPKARAAPKIPNRNYQGIILMEFVACIVLTAVTPIATKKESDGLSPYGGADMVKLASITVLFLILAGMSVAGKGAGRIAAWLGGLVLIVDGLYEASNIAKDFATLAGVGSNAANSADEGTAPLPGGPAIPGG